MIGVVAVNSLHRLAHARAHDALTGLPGRYVAEPFDIVGHQLHVGTSIGIALLDDHADDATSLIHNSDLAMYEAKRNGKNRIERFTPDMASA